MAVSVTLPALGESVTEGTVTRWLKQEGDHVEADEPLLEVSTDKVDTEIPAPASGVLLSITAAEDETVEVGAELGVIGDPSEAGASSSGQDDGGDGTAGTEGTDGTDGAADSGDSSGEAEAASSDTAETSDQPADSQPESQSESQSESQPESQPESQSESSAPPSGSSTGGATVSVTLPALGESVTEGTVTRWLKQEGDQVEADEPLLEVSTDKVDTEIPSPAAGVLRSITVAEDETVDVGAELAVIATGAADEGASGGDAAPSQETAAPEPPAPAESAETAPEQEQDKQQEPESEQKPEPEPEPEPAPAPAAAESRAPAHAASTSAPSGGASGAASYVTPLVRKLAAERDIDLGTLTGTGIGGRIRKQDVLAAARAAKQAAGGAAAPPSGPAATQAPASPPATESGGAPAPTLSPLRGRTEKLTRLRATIAKRMVESLRISAQLTTVAEVDVTMLARLRTRAKAEFEAREGVNLSFLPFFAKATCEALKSYPQLNASLNEEAGEVTYHDAEHLGIAVDTERGLLVATIRDAGDLNIAGLARKIADLATRTRDNKVTPDELSGGTFTITNTGSRGALFDTPILMQPQVGILGTGAVVKRPVVIDDPNLGETIAVRSMMYLALTYDHRLVDGADAARFLGAVKERLEDGAFESDLGL